MAIQCLCRLIYQQRNPKARL